MLDPLIDVEMLAPYGHAFSTNRVLHDSGWLVESNGVAIERLSRLEAIGLVDDAAVTGSTITHVVQRVRDSGGQVISIAVGCSTIAARDRAFRMNGETEWLQYVEGSRLGIHLRDGCPFVPLSGRPSAAFPAIQTASGTVLPRLLSVTRERGPWPAVLADYRVLAAMVSARMHVIASLSEALGRLATVSDLTLLGDDMPLPVYPRHTVSAATQLLSLV